MSETLLCDICYMPFVPDYDSVDNHNITICQDCVWKSRKIWQYGESKKIKTDVSGWSMRKFNRYMNKLLKR